MPLHCGFVWGRAHRRYSDCSLQFCLGGSYPPALTLVPGTLVLLHMPLAPFKLLLWCWSPNGVSLGKSTCGAFQEEMPENPAVSSPDPTPSGFYSQKLWESSSWNWNLGLGSLAWAWDLSLPIHCSILYPPHVGLGPAHSASLCVHPSDPPTSLDECGFLNSLVGRFPYSLVF